MTSISLFITKSLLTTTLLTTTLPITISTTITFYYEDLGASTSYCYYYIFLFGHEEFFVARRVDLHELQEE